MSTETLGERCVARMEAAKASGPLTRTLIATIINEEAATGAPAVALDAKQIPPDPTSVSLYARSIGYALDGAAFCDHYAAKGWIVGRTKMKDWKAAVRTWKARDQVKPTTQRTYSTYQS